eukprot:IDg22308t1
MTMTVLNGLPHRYSSIIIALDAIGDDHESFSLDTVHSRLLKAEKRSNPETRHPPSNRPAALVEQSQPEKGMKHCTHCGNNNHTEPYCSEKYGRPERYSCRHSRKKKRPSVAAIAEHASDHKEPDSDSEYVCLISKSESASSNARELVWLVDSGASHHMTFSKHAFHTYSCIKPFPVPIGGKSTTLVVGLGDVVL